ncbi:hypothetical protein C8J57DRAFT_1719229 [Mycena rebaudengoi]|nr:hypothetical protein C8J57DRAFT_1719229 [Mycena rebaudengoi]
MLSLRSSSSTGAHPKAQRPASLRRRCRRLRMPISIPHSHSRARNRHAPTAKPWANLDARREQDVGGRDVPLYSGAPSEYAKEDWSRSTGDGIYDVTVVGPCSDLVRTCRPEKARPRSRAEVAATVWIPQYTCDVQKCEHAVRVRVRVGAAAARCGAQSVDPWALYSGVAPRCIKLVFYKTLPQFPCPPLLPELAITLSRATRLRRPRPRASSPLTATTTTIVPPVAQMTTPTGMSPSSAARSPADQDRRRAPPCPRSVGPEASTAAKQRADKLLEWWNKQIFPGYAASAGTQRTAVSSSAKLRAQCAAMET